ncbi:hypothetical protein [Arthrobacter sp. zg-Y1143]|uniref:hypothetical protein n=1 Tax=Arthrobacter sp. zg-Y1143 TaxID=3049065 RepID=UPI0024C2F007|nr:hypothetical protein [Arthrobacter sp. zg-Y1143]MDK1327986.1 hypothetical protein [Arthrobacter sp. zg-Y1143]
MISTPADGPAPQTAPLDLLNQMLGLTDELARLQGGDWTYENGVVFDPARTTGYRGTLSCGDDNSRRFSVLIFGPGVPSPEDATAAAAKHLSAQGFAETNKFDDRIDRERYVIQTLSHPDGTTIVYEAGTDKSSIDVHSACSSHPGMAERTP